MYKHICGFIHTIIWGGGGFAVQVIKTGEGFCVFLIGEEILEDPKLQLTELNNLKKK